MLLPDTVGTGGDSHTRFPIGISFPAGSGLVAFAAATGVMPLDMPESVLVRFKGKMQPGVLRDLVNAIPLYAIKRPADRGQARQEEHLLGRILEIEGLPDLKVEQAFELSDASAERSAAGCTVPEQGTDHRVHQQQHHAAEVDDRRRLPGPAQPAAPHQGHGSLAGRSEAAGAGRRRRVRRRDRDRPGRRTSRSWPARTTRTT
jgi:homoaconitase/3-isopropylmalate dehydratase large subunit